MERQLPDDWIRFLDGFGLREVDVQRLGGPGQMIVSCGEADGIANNQVS